ncbi:hypothetical protein NM208_g5260 [Fusarium decemcellulare]|uniref:Uncharacterized protein n=1 Tax=Fusarium decemcellulare TaxID=57161 RepID=A0ACC1SHP0_9HYPO|nr:hypothetical protein NM208_g5260 [Fusarium decemcellulare]
MKAAYFLSLLTLALAAPKNDELTLNDFSDIVDVSDPVIQSAWESAVSFTETSGLEPRSNGASALPSVTRAVPWDAAAVAASKSAPNLATEENGASVLRLDTDPQPTRDKIKKSRDARRCGEVC